MTVVKRKVSRIKQKEFRNTFERRFFMRFSLNLFCGHVKANVEVALSGGGESSRIKGN